MAGRVEIFEALLREGIKSIKNSKKLQESLDPIMDAVTAPAALPPVTEPAPPPAPMPAAPQAAAPVAPAVPPTPASPDATGTVPEEITIDTIINKLNDIRGGRSFDGDPEVYGHLTTMFRGLPPEDKTTLDRLLTQISEIVVPPQAQQQSAQPPASPPQPATPMAPPPAAPPPPVNPLG